MMQRRRIQPIALIIFDAFDTLVTPRIAPYLQYAEEAKKVGLDVDDEHVKTAFKASFKRLAKAHPTYGVHTGLRSADDWWLLLIEESMLESGVPAAALQPVLPSLGSALLRRFGSADAYMLAEGVPNVLEQLANLHSTLKSQTAADEAQQYSNTTLPAQLTMSLATNSDARILDACKALGLARHLDLTVQYDMKRPATNLHMPQPSAATTTTNRIAVSGPTLSYDVGYEKPDARFFHAAVQRAFPSPGDAAAANPLTLQQMCQRTLYVGDSFHEDYLGAKRAGLQAVWLKRAQSLPDTSETDDSDIVAITSMLDVIHIVRESWRK